MSSQYTDSAERQWCDFRSQLREHQESMDLTEWNNHRSQLREQTAPVQEYIENHRGFVVSGATLHAACKDGRLDVCEFLSTFPFFLQKIRNREDSRPLMHFACGGGHLSVCKWLFRVGAAADITKMDDDLSLIHI